MNQPFLFFVFIDSFIDRRYLFLIQICLEFQYASYPEGVIFFVENTETSEVLSIQLIGGKVAFEFNNRDQTLEASVQVFSPAQLNTGTWYKVCATR